MNWLGIGAGQPAYPRWSGCIAAGSLTLGALLAACSGETCAPGASRAVVLGCGQSLRDHFLDLRCPFHEVEDLRQAGLSAIRELATLIGDGDAGLRLRASETLQCLGPVPGQAEVAHALLIALPIEPDVRVKMELVLALSVLRSQAARISPAIRALISAHEEDGYVRMAAAFAHWRLTMEETTAAELFAWALSAENSELDLSYAAHYLARMGTFPRLLVKEVAAGLSNPDFSSRYWCAVALGNVGPEAIGATGSLEKLLDDPYSAVRDAAHSALCKIHEGYMRPEWSRGR
ncbi:MAG: HEAT repeat domain-containing protein [Planctomycetaceae bacterium]